jgi:RNA polymerase sigma-70 factor (ECF subfamily)
MVDDRVALDIEQLVAEHHQMVYRIAYRLSGSVPDAEDLTQQVFLIAQEKLSQLRSPQSAGSWLVAILRNLFLKIRQKRRPIPAESLRLDLEMIPAAAPRPVDVDRERLQQALNEVPPRFRLVLTMFYYEGRSYREIADRLQVPIGTVMSRLARAKGYLRSKLFDREGHTVVAPQKSPVSHGG